MITWASIVLCTDGDIVAYESSWPQWTTDTDSWRAKAKAEIEKRLRHVLKERELLTDAAEVLDLIGNPAVLTDAACYMALHLCANNNIMVPQDMWALKAKTYEDKFDAEFERAVTMLEFDADESGAIDDSEKYQISGAVRFGRGGPLIVGSNDEP